MKKTYYFISMGNKVDVYVEKGHKPEGISAAVKYSIESGDFWTWFENSVGELEGNLVYFLSDEKKEIPERIQSLVGNYSLSKLKSAMKHIFHGSSLEVLYGEDLSFYCYSKDKEKTTLFLIYPLETEEDPVVLEKNELEDIGTENLEDSTSSLSREGISETENISTEKSASDKLVITEKSSIKKAFEDIYKGYHEKN